MKRVKEELNEKRTRGSRTSKIFVSFYLRYHMVAMSGAYTTVCDLEILSCNDRFAKSYLSKITISRSRQEGCKQKLVSSFS